MQKKKSRFKAKILSGYRVTIPEELRNRMDIKIGQEVELEARGGEIIIKVSEEDPVFLMLGAASGAVEEQGDKLFLEELEEKRERE